MSNRVEEIVQELVLQPHPEGGFYKETYRSSEMIEHEALFEGFRGNRSYATAIYFLLTKDNFSAWHKINSDEGWHFYEGDALRIHMISPEGEYSYFDLGLNFGLNQQPQFVVPKGYYFASEVKVGGSYALVGCTVAPGFDFDDFVLPSRAELMEVFPEHKEVITHYTRF